MESEPGSSNASGVFNPHDFTRHHRDKVHLDERWDINPGVRSVVLYERNGDGYDAAKPIRVGIAEQSPITTRDDALFRKVDDDLKRCLWTLSVPTFCAEWNQSFSPMAVKVAVRCLIKETNGDEWIVVGVGGGVMQWRLPCIELLGQRIIEG